MNKVRNHNSKSPKPQDSPSFNSVLVYSNDPKDQKILSGETQKLAFIETQNSVVLKNNFTVVFRLEKNGRGGKTVTILDQLPQHETFLKELTKELKVKCGVGGSYFLEAGRGCIEIQGDKRDAIKKILDLKKIKYKGV